MLLFTLPFLFRSGVPWELQGNQDPRFDAVPAPVGSTYRLTRTAQLFQKFGEGHKDWLLVSTVFALLNFDWQNGLITSATNLSAPVVVSTGIRDFTFDAPIDDPNLAVITASVEPVIVDAQIAPPIQVFAKITGPGTGLRVTVYPTQANIAGNAVDPTDSVVRAFVRVERVTP